MRFLLVALALLGALADPVRAQAPVKVTIVTQPSEARIYDQQAQYLGLTGQESAIPFARYGGQAARLRLVKDGYQPVPVELRPEQLEAGRYPEQGAIPLVPVAPPPAGWGRWVILAGMGLTVGLLALAQRGRKGAPTPEPVLPLAPPLGPYELLERLGAGAMGEVFRAVHAQTREVVALKVVHPPPDERSQAEFFERWRREAKITSQLSHKGIVKVVDYGQCEGRHYLAMELLEGRTLEEVLHEGPVPLAQARPLLQQLFLAVGYAHRQGVKHRDLKPANLMITAGGQLKVMDFGLARDESSTAVTKTDAALGTPTHIAPEQWAGGSQAASDQYAVGLIAYQLLTGRLPFEPHEMDVLQLATWHMSQPPSPPSFYQPRLGPSVDEVILRMVAKAPHTRYPSLEAAWSALDQALPRS